MLAGIDEMALNNWVSQSDPAVRDAHCVKVGGWQDRLGQLFRPSFKEIMVETRSEWSSRKALVCSSW